MSTLVARKWSGLELVEFDEDHYIQLAFRFNEKGFREYWVQWSMCEESTGSEYYLDEYEDNKRLAYGLYRENLEKLETHCA